MSLIANKTYIDDESAFLNNEGKIFEVAPPNGVSQKEFALSVINYAESYNVQPVLGSRVYWLLFANSNVAAGYPFLRAGGTLPSKSEVGFAPGLWDYEPMSRAQRTPTPSLP